LGLNWIKRNNATTNWHVALALTRGTIVTWHVDIFFEIKKNLIFFLNLKKFKFFLKKPGADTWHVLFKWVNYLNTVSEKDQIDHNLTKMKT